MRLWLVLLAVGCSKHSFGESCDYDGDCSTGYCAFERCTMGEVGSLCKYSECNSGLRCFKSQCREPGAERAACEWDGDCREGMTCIEERCVAAEHVDEERRKLAAAKEAKLLAQSGVQTRPPIEQQINPAATGARVRTATASASGTAFAACRTDERLVGGGCRTEASKYPTIGSYPSGQGSDDTVGARWNCEGGAREITAYALCAKLP